MLIIRQTEGQQHKTQTKQTKTITTKTKPNNYKKNSFLMTKFDIKMIWRQPLKWQAHSITLQIQISFPSAPFLCMQIHPLQMEWRTQWGLHYKYQSQVISPSTYGPWLLWSPTPNSYFNYQKYEAPCAGNMFWYLLPAHVLAAEGKAFVLFCFHSLSFVVQTGWELVWPRLVLNLQSSCLSLYTFGIKGRCTDVTTSS